MGLKLALKKKKKRKTGTQSRCGIALLFKQHHAGGKAVDEILAAHWSQLSGGEETGQGYRPDLLAYHSSVVVGLAKQFRSAAVAGEQQAACRPFFMRCQIHL